MQNLKLLLPLALFIIAFFVACHEDEPFGIGPSADVTFVGPIMDEDGDAVQGALVKAGNENTVSDANGNAYSGAVRVFARYLDPSDPMLGLFLPGDMTAENAAEEEVFLDTYGMVGVKIEGSNGQKLKIAADKEVELRMPIIASQLAAAPATIPLWHYDAVIRCIFLWLYRC